MTVSTIPNSLVAAFILGLSATHLSATTIEFESGTYLDTPGAQTYSEAGFTFTTGLNDHFDSNNLPGNPVFPGGLPFLVFHEAAANPTNNIVTLNFGGNAFNFGGFELLSDPRVIARNPRINPQMTVTASDGRSFLTPVGAAPGFVGPISVDWRRITFVTFDIVVNSAVSGNVLMDNVTVVPSTIVAPVPLPAAGVLLAGCLAGMAAWGRRKPKR